MKGRFKAPLDKRQVASKQELRLDLNPELEGQQLHVTPMTPARLARTVDMEHPQIQKFLARLGRAQSQTESVSMGAERSH